MKTKTEWRSIPLDTLVLACLLKKWENRPRVTRPLERRCNTIRAELEWRAQRAMEGVA